MIAWVASAALAATVAVTTGIEGTYASESAVQSAAWHALVERDHAPIVLDRDLVAAPATMRARGATTLFDLHVRWHVEALSTGDGLLPAPYPEVSVTEYALDRGALTPVRTWTRLEPPVVHRDPELGWYSLPDRTLQRAIGAALEVVPVGEERRDNLLPLPILVAADEEYRARYGDEWREVALARIERASRVLAPAGFRLEIAEWQEWRSPDEARHLEGLLASLARAPRRDDTLRVGLTGQIDLSRADSAEDVGLAYSPGADVLVGDLRLPELEPGWDLAEEAVVVAHELLHALGVPHTRHAYLLMSESKHSAVHVLSEPSRELARAAVQVRRAHWDPLAALDVLAHVAAVHIQAPDAQVAYILANLDVGPGVPAPGQVEPRSVSALVNVAMGRYYLERARSAPLEAVALRQSALAHGLAALSEAPALAAPLLQILSPPEPEPTPAVDPVVRCGGASPWVLAPCLDL